MLNKRSLNGKLSALHKAMPSVLSPTCYCSCTKSTLSTISISFHGFTDDGGRFMTPFNHCLGGMLGQTEIIKLTAIWDTQFCTIHSFNYFITMQWHTEHVLFDLLQAANAVRWVFDHPCVEGVTGGILDRFRGPGWDLPGPAGPALAQMQGLLSRHGTGISVGPKHTSCYLRVTDSCIWIFIQSAD